LGQDITQPGRATKPQRSTAPKSVARKIVRLTCLEPVPTLAGFRRSRRRQEGGSRVDEANVSAQCPPQKEDARFQESHGDQGGPQGPQAAESEGTQTADGIAGRLPRRERLTGGSDFQTLFRHGQRIDRPSMVVLWRQTEADHARRAGFTVSRQVRGAVPRNRVKRRLREAYRETRGAAPTRVSMVVVGRPAALHAPMVTVVGDMRRAFHSIPGARSS